jgi:protein-disulfide isomerase/Skp family chaperone for outer membrane proteins
MKFRSFAPLAFTLGLVALTTACEAGGAKKAGVGNFVQLLPDETVIVEYQGGSIKAKDLKDQLQGEVQKMNEEILDTYKRAGENMVIRKLLDEEAKKQGLSGAEALVEKTASTSAVTDEQIKAFIKENKEQIEKDPKTGKKIKVDQKVLEQQVRMHLENQDKQGRVQALVGGIRANAKVKFKLEEPRTQLSEPAHAPFLGGASAKVVIHEFSDFECPFCSKGRAVVDQIHAAYGDKVKVLFRHFPLNFHQNAKPAAIASICAQKQGKFWEMHNKLFENQRGLTEEAFKGWAKEIGLDATSFDACLKDESVGKIVDADMEAASKIGVNSTPTFFVNGRKVAGALPFEQFKAMIDEELAN